VLRKKKGVARWVVFLKKRRWMDKGGTGGNDGFKKDATGST
jgi:hypothetical protein